MQRKSVLKLAMLVMMVMVWGCDPEKVLNEYFAKMGLTRLAVLRDDIEPGGLVLVSDGKAHYADNMLDYVPNDAAQDFSIAAKGGQDEYNAILRSQKSDRTIEPNVAISFMQKVLPVSLGSDFKLSDKVNIDLIDAKVKRLKIPTVSRFLASNSSGEFRNALWDFAGEKKGIESYLIYETWRAKKLKISTESDHSITPSLKVGEVKSLISSIDAKFTLTRTDNSSLEIDGDHYYVFAVRTAQLARGANRAAVSLKVTNFSTPADWGIMAAGTDEKYSISPTGSFETPLLLQK